MIRAITDQYGCDAYIERTGSPVGVTQGLDLIRKLGRVVEFSVFGSDTTVDWSIIGDRKKLDVRGAHLGPYCVPIAIDLLARGLVTSKGILTHGFTLERVGRGSRSRQFARLDQGAAAAQVMGTKSGGLSYSTKRGLQASFLERIGANLMSITLR